MVHPPSQTVTAKEGESLNIVVEFCAEPRYTKVLWMSEESVYVPGTEARDGVQALAIEVRFLVFYEFTQFFTRFGCTWKNTSKMIISLTHGGSFPSHSNVFLNFCSSWIRLIFVQSFCTRKIEDANY